jgi:hypothetical protein
VTVKRRRCRRFVAGPQHHAGSALRSRYAASPAQFDDGTDVRQSLSETLTFQPIRPKTKTAMRTMEGETRSNPGPHLRTFLTLRAYARFFASATSAAWNFATSLFATKRPSAVSMSVFHALLATTPCVSEPASLSAFHCLSAHLR